jgi:cysteinyl-tRNA synthetase
VLGLGLDRVPVAASDLDPRTAALIAERTALRAAGNYARADAIRDELRLLGLEITDDAGGRTRSRPTK